MRAVTPTRRVTPRVAAGRRRSETIAVRLGVALREARTSAGLTQGEVAARSGMSQAAISALERGLGAPVSIEHWALAAAAVDEQLAAFIERAPGAHRPRDFEHLRRQRLVIDFARPGRWAARIEEPLDQDRRRSRSVDVVLSRPTERDVVVVEVWDWFDDVGAALRSLDGKVAEVVRQSRARDPGWRASALWVVRGTRRNHALVHEFAPIFRIRFPGDSRAWLAALGDPAAPMPEDPGLLWTDREARRLVRSRLVHRRDGPTD
jgi:transcriptional regulator with XRE-family HTH domain